MSIPPYKVLVRAGHNVGKSFLAACLVNWWYDSFQPGICLTTAPTDRQVRDILWKEVRVLRGPRGGFPGPKMCRLESSPEHFAHGFTAREGTRFQGHHGPAVLIVFDEACGVDPVFWEAAQTMLGGNNYGFFGIYNPTDQSSRVYIEERTGQYHTVSMSALDHPNIAAELAGQPPPYPTAIRLGRLRELLHQWATPVTDHGPTDVQLGDEWFRPGPIAESRLLGRWPSLAVNAVWSERTWELSITRELPDTGPLQIGCDVARFGDDFTAIHVRKGGVSLHHEAWNGWTVPQIVERLKSVAHQWGKRYGVDERRIPIAVDDAGVGGGVTDYGDDSGYHFVGVNSACRAEAYEEDYPNMRSALWFGLADEAGRGNVYLGRLPQGILSDLRRECMAPTYRLDLRGRRVVESKDETKERLQRSPDNADAMNLAYANVFAGPDTVGGVVRVPT